jgi:hypothetical protein
MRITKYLNILVFVLVGALIGVHFLMLDPGMAAHNAPSPATLLRLGVFLCLYTALGIGFLYWMGRKR